MGSARVAVDVHVTACYLSPHVLTNERTNYACDPSIGLQLDIKEVSKCLFVYLQQCII